METPLEQEEIQTTAAEIDAVPSEQPEQTDTTPTARENRSGNRFTTGQMASSISDNSALVLSKALLSDGKKLTEIKKVVFALAGGDETTGDRNETSQASNIELYASTSGWTL